MTETFLCADLHLGHTNIVERYGRPFATIQEHDETIVKNWNSVVGTKAHVKILGDVVFAKTSLPYLAELNGEIELIPGNHDRHKLEEYLKYFKRLCLQGSKPYKDMVLTHIPIHPQCLGRWSNNVHGHLHGNEVMRNFFRATVPDTRYLCVSMERIGYTPLSLDDVRKAIKERQFCWPPPPTEPDHSGAG